MRYIYRREKNLKVGNNRSLQLFPVVYKYVKERRRIVSPNADYISALKMADVELSKARQNAKEFLVFHTLPPR